MNLAVIARGIVLGFAIAAPVGPIGVLCIRRTLANGQKNGLVSGLGAATADAIYGSIAAFGLTAISSLLVDQQLWLRLGGGAFLAYLGIRTLLARPSEEEAAQAKGDGTTLFGAYSSTLILTLTNPMTILSFVGIMAGMGVAAATDSAAFLVFGVFLGSALWWLALSLIVGAFRRRIGPEIMLWINRASGVIILAFAVWSLVGAFKG